MLMCEFSLNEIPIKFLVQVSWDQVEARFLVVGRGNFEELLDEVLKAKGEGHDDNVFYRLRWEAP